MEINSTCNTRTVSICVRTRRYNKKNDIAIYKKDSAERKTENRLYFYLKKEYNIIWDNHTRATIVIQRSAEYTQH